MSRVPPGWTKATIGDVTLGFSTIDPTRTPDRTFRYVDIGSIDNETQTITQAKTIKGADAPSRARRVVQTADVLFSTVRTYLRNVALVPKELDGELTSTGIAILRPSDAVEPGYLFAWTRSDEFINEVSPAQDGTLYPAVTDRDVSGARVLLPPLAEQRRIVAKIDSLSAKSKRAREQLDHVPRLVEQFKKAVLQTAYDGRLLSEPWEVEQASAPISDLVVSLDQGWSPKCESYPAASMEQWAVVKTTSIQEIEFQDHENKALPSTLTPRKELELVVGDVLITRAGPRSRVGVACYVRACRPRLMLCDKAYRLRVKRGSIDPLYMTFMLNAPFSKQVLEEMKTGISDSGLNLTQGKLLGMTLPLVSLASQREIVCRIERAFAWIDRLAAEAAGARRLVDRLDQAILTRAFRGELVPQDPADEPAGALLERIRAERAGGAAPGRRARRGGEDGGRAPGLRTRRR